MNDLAIETMFQTVMGHTPYMQALGIVYDGFDDQGVRLKLPYQTDLIADEATGVLASGAVTALLDQGCGLAVWSKIGHFVNIATLDLRIDYMRAAEPGLDLFMAAQCYKLTRSIGFVRAFAYETTPDDPVAAAQGAFMLTGVTKVSKSA
jgi:uncharacterized protein (TIGR00369 family)